jgi:hypothetical protein
VGDIGLEGDCGGVDDEGEVALDLTKFTGDPHGVDCVDVIEANFLGFVGLGLLIGLKAGAPVCFDASGDMDGFNSCIFQNFAFPCCTSPLKLDYVKVYM